jgi:hypothetical protein
MPRQHKQSSMLFLGGKHCLLHLQVISVPSLRSLAAIELIHSIDQERHWCSYEEKIRQEALMTRMDFGKVGSRDDDNDEEDPSDAWLIASLPRDER